MKYNNHPKLTTPHLSFDTLVRITNSLSSTLGLDEIDPVVIRATIISGNGTTEIVGDANSQQIIWIRADSICYLRFRDFRLCYAYATRDAIERDLRFAANFYEACDISFPNVITDAAREVMLSIGKAVYWVAPEFLNLLTEEERRYASGNHVDIPAASGT